MTRTVTNDIPQALLDVARTAISLGMTEVTVGFMYMGSDFPSPIDWALHLMKRQDRFDAPADAPKSHLALTMSRGQDAPSAYVGPFGSENPYWNVEQVTAWMHESVEPDGEYIPGWAPVTDEVMQQHLLGNWELFHEGVLSGWTMEHKVDWSMFASLRDLYSESERAEMLPQTNLRWNITNTFYNEKKHPAYRGKDDDNTMPVSIGGYSFRRTAPGVEIEAEAYLSSNAAPYHERITAEAMREILTTTAPWFVRVATDDEALDEWVHFPEATDWKESAEGAARALADTQRALAMNTVPVTMYTIYEPEQPIEYVYPNGRSQNDG